MMMLTSRAVTRNAAIAFLIPFFILAGCQKQQNNSQQAHEKLGGAGHQKIRVVCADDIQKFCANADKKKRCLRENMDKLSDTCKSAVGQRRGRKMRDNNGGDDD